MARLLLAGGLIALHSGLQRTPASRVPDVQRSILAAVANSSNQRASVRRMPHLATCFVGNDIL
jgi:hypothetical protein